MTILTLGIDLGKNLNSQESDQHCGIMDRRVVLRRRVRRATVVSAVFLPRKGMRSG
jgi:hypothetical protein